MSCFERVILGTELGNIENKQTSVLGLKLVSQVQYLYGLIGNFS